MFIKYHQKHLLATFKIIYEMYIPSSIKAKLSYRVKTHLITYFKSPNEITY